MFLNFFLLMEILGAMADSRYTGFREITDCDVLELHCSNIAFNSCNQNINITKILLCLQQMLWYGAKCYV